MTRKNQRKILCFLILSIFITILSCVLLIIYINNILLSIIFIFTLVIGFILTIKNKIKFDSSTYLFRYELLLENALLPIKLKTKIDSSDVIKLFENSNYSVFSKTKNYITIYKIETYNKKQVLKVALIILKKSISFSDIMINDLFEATEKKLEKKLKKNYHRMFFQVKFDLLKNEDNIADANNVYYTSNNRFHVALINLIIDNNDSSFYFLHSNNFNPSSFYNLACQELLKIIK